MEVGDDPDEAAVAEAAGFVDEGLLSWLGIEVEAVEYGRGVRTALRRDTARPRDVVFGARIQQPSQSQYVAQTGFAQSGARAVQYSRPWVIIRTCSE